MMSRICLLFLMVWSTCITASSQLLKNPAVIKTPQVIPLYEGHIPGSKSAINYKEDTETGNDGRRYISHVTLPTLTVYLPEKQKPNGVSVIICPGGGYIKLAIDHEGVELAKRFNEYGITAFILKYRLPHDSIMENKMTGPLQDAQQAIRLVRKRSAEWRLDTARIGILGASAGGHLAAMAGTSFDSPVIADEQHISVRPAFMILMYPVISLTQMAHTSSARSLLGKDLTERNALLYSCENRVTANTPPAFLVHASDDRVVPAQHSILFYQALIARQIPAEIHIYEKGGHGFGVHNRTTKDDWFERLFNWMGGNKVILREGKN